MSIRTVKQEAFPKRANETHTQSGVAARIESSGAQFVQGAAITRPHPFYIHTVLVAARSSSPTHQQ